MQQQISTITQAVEGIGVRLAELYDISVSRLYQILEADFYGKTKRLIRMIAAIDKERVKIIKADLDALFCELLGETETREVPCADLHKELTDVIQAKLNDFPKDIRLHECRQAVAALSQEISSLETKEEIRADVFGRAA
jgi:hypothetical protein